ncbi:MAG: hypothetical protein KTR17_02350 [Cellvibrionaceae bacterium]|nr:hypothetical protein [Cellvibrionaceae bacterium]
MEGKLKDQTGRLVIVSSDAHNMAPKNIGVDFHNISAEHKYSAARFYGQSKLANIAFAKSMSERLADRNIIANSLHPGVITGTSLFRHTPKPLAWVFSLFSKTIEQGAATQCYLAAHSDLTGKTAGYFSHCKLAKVKAPGDDPEFRSRLWRFSMEIIKKHAPDLDSIT